MALYTYSAPNIQISIKNILVPKLASGYTVTGLAADEFLTIETESEDWVIEEGSDGVGVRSLIPNKITNIVLTLQQTSPTNDILTELREIGKGIHPNPSLGVGADIFTLSVKNPIVPLNSTEEPSFFCTSTFVSKIAPMSYAKEAGTRAWEITAFNGIFGKDALAAINQATSLVRDTVAFSKNFSL